MLDHRFTNTPYLRFPDNVYKIPGRWIGCRKWCWPYLCL